MAERSSNGTEGRSGERSTAPIVAAVAASLRRLREERGLSIGELARRAGIAKSTVSQLEAGSANPSIETLWALALALDVPFGRLVDAGHAGVRVVRAGEAPAIEAEGADYRARILSSGARRAAHDISIVEAEPGPGREAPPHLPGTVEHLVVLAGRMRLGPVGREVEAGVGDYVAFGGDVPHRYEALAPGTVAVLVLEHP